LRVDFRVELPEQVDIAGSLELFRRSGDDLIDRWDGRRLVRAVRVSKDRWVPFVARAVHGSKRPAFDVSVLDPADAEVVKCTVATMFAPAPAEYGQFLRRDAVLAGLDEPEVRAATAHWGASAGVAQAVLLHALGEGVLTPPKPLVSRAGSPK
jgi:hypothetical protein